MVAGPYDFHCVRSEPLDVTITIENPDGRNADLTLYSSRMHVRRLVSSEDTIIELTTDNGRLIHDPENGIIRVYLSDSETASLSDEGVYDLELVNNINGSVLRLIQGNFFLTG